MTVYSNLDEKLPLNFFSGPQKLNLKSTSLIMCAHLGSLVWDESGDVPPPTTIYNLKPLSKEKLKELLNNEYPDLNTSLKSRFSEIAEGYRKIALLLVENYRSKAMETEDILSINDQDLIDELIAGNKLNRFSEDFRKIKKVLMGISLFKKVGYKEDLVTQAKWISEYFGDLSMI